MNRIEIIRALAAKHAQAIPHRPKGMHCATTGVEPATDNRPKDRKRGLGVLLRGSWGPLNRPDEHRRNWVTKPDARQRGSLKAGFRHGPHALTRIAERLTRKWQA